MPPLTDGPRSAPLQPPRELSRLAGTQSGHGKAAHPKIAGQHFRFLASCQRPESGAKPLPHATCKAPSPRRVKTSAQVRAHPTIADSNGVEPTSSGFSPFRQS